MMRKKGKKCEGEDGKGNLLEFQFRGVKKKEWKIGEKKFAVGMSWSRTG